MPPADPAHPTDRPADPRARAAQTKRDRTRRALLDAADSIFGSRGWARTRIEDVAAAAGVSAATAYNHFPTKHALIAHVYGPLLRPLLVQAQRHVASGAPVVEALEDQVRALARLTTRNRVLTRSLCCAVLDYTIRVEGPASPDDEGDPRVLVPMPEAIRLLVEHGQATGELRPFPAAVDISHGLANLLLTRSMNLVDESTEDRAANLLAVLFGTLRPEHLARTPPPAPPNGRSPSDPSGC